MRVSAKLAVDGLIKTKINATKSNKKIIVSKIYINMYGEIQKNIMVRNKNKDIFL